jgi:VWFA-related protein
MPLKAIRMHVSAVMRRALVLAFAVSLAVSLAAQEPRFDVRSRLVLVPVTVTDLKGRSIDGLEASDFLLSDNGRPQKATVDTMDTGVAPVALVIAVQSSGISAAVLEKVRKIGAMIQPIVTGERGCAGVVSFAERVTWLQECTNDQDALDRAFDELRPLLRPGEEKQGRMLDAVQSAVEHLRRRPNARRVLLLISESRDRGSETALEVAIAAAQSAGVTVYAATYSALKTAFTSKLPVSQPRRPLKPKTPNDAWGSVNPFPPGKYNPWPRIPPPEQQVDALGGIGELARLYKTNTTEALAKSTGGTTFPFTRQKALEEAIGKLGAELHTQYVVSFVPEISAAGFHTLEVRLARPGEFRLRARPGYWSTEEPR